MFPLKTINAVDIDVESMRVEIEERLKKLEATRQEKAISEKYGAHREAKRGKQGTF